MCVLEPERRANHSQCQCFQDKQRMKAEILAVEMHNGKCLFVSYLSLEKLNVNVGNYVSSSENPQVGGLISNNTSVLDCVFVLRLRS